MQEYGTIYIQDRKGRWKQSRGAGELEKDDEAEQGNEGAKDEPEGFARTEIVMVAAHCARTESK